ncbi:MAG: T9SS type A sorting domain-containing protein [Ignavibacteriaceae bacterium]|nr:T9SS type A sorting domain-containing protein [Ignavibacteriaceae bacterium]
MNSKSRFSSSGHISCTVILLLIISIPVAAQIQLAWERWLDYQVQDVPVKMTIDKGNNIYIAGSTDDGYDYDYLLVKYNTFGELQWIRTFNGPSNWDDGIANMLLDDSSNIYLTGYMSTTFGTAFSTLKYDTNGNLLWEGAFSRTSLGFNWGSGNSILIDNEGISYITGFLASNSAKKIYTLIYKPNGSLKNILFPSTTDIYNSEGIQLLIDDSNCLYVCCRKNEGDKHLIGIQKYDKNLTLIWDKNYSTNNPSLNFANGFIFDKKKGLIYILSKNHLSASNGFSISTIDTMGNLVWTKSYTSDESEFFPGSFSFDSENNLLTIGYMRSNFESGYNVFILKISSDGDILWEKKYEKEKCSLNRILHKIDKIDNIYITSSIYRSNISSPDILITKFDSTGNLLWEEIYDSPTEGSYSEPIDFSLTDKDELIITGFGSSKSEYWNPFEILTIKYIPSVSNIIQNEAVPIEFGLSQNYPNPFNPITTIKYSIPITCNVLIKVFDLLGNEVKILVNEIKTPGNYSVNFNASSFASGTFFYKIFANNYSQTKKMILIK